MKDKSTRLLVQKAMRGNQHAFAQLLEKKVREIVFLCSREMQSYQDGEDAAQEVCIQLQQGIRQLRSADAFNVWLNRIVYTTCVKMKRDGMKMQNNLSIDPQDPAGVADELFITPSFLEDVENRRLVGELVDALPGEYRRYVLMHYYQGLKYSEIAEITGVEVHTVANGLRAARLLLKKQLDETLGEDSPNILLAAAMPGGVLLGSCLTEYAKQAITSQMAAGVLQASGIKTAGHIAGTSVAKSIAAAGLSVAVVGAGITGALHLRGTPPPAAPPASVQAVAEADVAFGGSLSLQNTALDP